MSISSWSRREPKVTGSETYAEERGFVSVSQQVVGKFVADCLSTVCVARMVSVHAEAAWLQK